MLSVVAFAATLLCSASAHVTLRYPLPLLRNDFLDNARTKDLCGLEPSTDESALWELPTASNPVTTLTAGEPVDVSWDLHYAHQGGFTLELYDDNLTMVHRWNTSNAGTVWGDDTCAVDGTIRSVTIDLPASQCNNCTLRLLRQAKEWGAGYQFKSCARVNIVNATDACQGCSGRGTCGGNGQCQCEGNFYGSHCQFENECSTDSECGPRGKCIDVEDRTGPTQQCFCEAGWFGSTRRSSTGLERRFCDTPTSLPIITGASDYNAGLNMSESSAGGEFEVAWSIVDPDIEIAIAAQTTSWVALGMRSAGEEGSSSSTGATTSAPASSEASAESSNSEPAPEAEQSSPSSEGEYRRRRSRMVLQAPTPEAEAPSAPATSAPAAEGSSASAEGEGAPAAEGEGAPAAEGEGSGSTQVCAAVAAADVVSPQRLTGLVITPAEAARLQAAAGAPAAEGEGAPAAEGEGAPAAEGAGAPAAEGSTAEGAPAGRRLKAAMPDVESEAVSRAAVARHHMYGRKLAQSEGGAAAETPAAEGSSASSEGASAEGASSEGASAEGAAAESEGGGATSAQELPDIASGVCAGQGVTPQTAHAMINQDVVFAIAREVNGTQYFRIVDMFTPSRAKPLPDHEFCTGTGANRVCGTDDIVDAIAIEVNGATYIRFKRALVSPDPSFTDTCLSDDQRITMVYAFGQLTASASHTPFSSLEVIPASQRRDQDFYPPDVLRFHGGGIGTSFPGRGSLGTRNLFVDEAAATGGACTPSTEPGFDCQAPRFGGSMIIHYNAFQPGDTEATFGIELPSQTGWGAIGFPDPGSPTAMVGSTAVIVTDDAASGIGVFQLNGKSVAGVTEVGGGRRRLSQTAFDITEGSVERAGGRTFATFTRPFDDSFTASAAAQPLLAAYGAGNNLAYHSDREDFTLALSVDAAAGAGSSQEDLSGYYEAHGLLMAFAWGVFAPLGVTMAAATRNVGKVSDKIGPVWFLGHRIFMLLAVVLSTIGFAIAVAKFDLQKGDEYYKHKVVGYIVVIVGWWQPLNALLRPHPPGNGEKTSLARIIWQALHKLSGYSAYILGIINIGWGIALGGERALYDDDDRTTYETVFIVWIVFHAVATFALFILDRWRGRKIAKEESSKAQWANMSGRDASVPVNVPDGKAPV